MEDEKVDDESLNGISCLVSFILYDDDNLQFDCNWFKEEDLIKLAALINAIKNTDLLKNNIKHMECEESAKNLLLSLFKPKPYVLPSEVYGGQNES